METTIWQLRFDVAWVHLLRWMIDPAGQRDLNPEFHLYLADRYARLAQHYDRVGNRKKRTRFEEKAKHHYRLGGGGNLPPAVAMRASIPQPPTFTKAIGQPPESDGPDDAA
ncbi:hypothetical protein [Candidatus Manganitrophus noduliformans]|uniref:Uncharacterized protein n=1 Tax=Candidatus Manganitrophus noduliformans TaxID=2606439 RepID=A0A7X6DNZ0_9BACT|nr:hypothetical protein [Candidatus Manganitrophus noduliformans]NKE70622.1 hypothetical protein [Candidatus Manganitrophus noduliformans]